MGAGQVNKLLCIFNVCGVRGLERLDRYVRHIESCLRQEGDGWRVVVSGCCSTRTCKSVLRQKLGNRVSFNWIDQVLPVFTTCNHTVDQCVQRWGAFDGYVYLDSGVDIGAGPWPHEEDERVGVFRNLHQRIRSEVVAMSNVEISDGGFLHDVPCEGMLHSQNAMVAVGVDEDTGYEWWGLRPPRGEDFVIPVGRTINLHSQAFSEDLRQAYGRILPDVFASDTGESIFTFMTAAIGRRFLLMGKPTVRHEHSMDGASVGFRGKPLTFKIEMDEFRRRIFDEGKRVGFGYELCQQVLPHDPSLYDSEGNCLTAGPLRAFIRDNMFLRPEEFSYESVKHTFEE
jgi:hypothetical protein